MEPRVNFITVATADLDAARTFYRDGLGWSPLLDVPGEIVFFQVGPGLVLGFFEQSLFVADLISAGAAGEPGTDWVGGVGGGEAVAVSGLTLSHNVGSEAAVDETFAAAVRAGARVVKPPQTASFGGYHAHIADPNGTVWEIAYNPGWRVDSTGTVVLGPEE